MAATPISRSQSRLDLIRVEAEDQVALNGLLWEPQAGSDSLVLMVPGGTTGAALFPAHDYSPLASALIENGYAFLLSNLRASYNNPYAEYAEAVKERNEPAVKAVGFIASIPSPYLEFQIRGSEAEKRRLEEMLAHARELVAQGKGQEPVGFENWFPEGLSLMGTAKSIISFFGAPSDPGTPSSIKYGPKIRVPALVIHGEKDELSLPPNAQKIYESLTASPQRDLVWVKGASHFLTPGPLAESYARLTVAWLVRNFPVSPRR
jgi:pimeloyl-ACP methyl ester carboxylesterase